MPKTIDKKHLLNLGYIIIFSLFLIVVYYLVNFCFRTFFSQASFFSNLDQRAGNNSQESPLENSASASSSLTISGDKTLIFSSFFDSFASGHLIDLTSTNLYRDDLSAAVYFPPLYTWELASADIITETKKNFSKVYLNDYLLPLNNIDRRCLEGKCLEQKGKRLVFQGKALSLPKDIKAADIVGLTIGSLESRWLVGITLKDGANYQGRVYFFDGKKYSPVILSGTSEKISSPYLGLFGFGGHESDFLVIYGAYRGQAFRLQDGKTTDISEFFDFRVMATGFQPEVIRATNGRVVNWYIYSSSLERPRLIKLWQNSRGEISGEADYNDIFENNEETVIFNLLETNPEEFVLVSSIYKDNLESVKTFTDRGFDNKMPGELIFNPINIDAEIVIKQLANSNLGTSLSPCLEAKFSFSSDNNNWQELPCGQNLNQEFTAPVKNNYFLRVDFPGQTEKFYSPFLTEVLFDFYYQK